MFTSIGCARAPSRSVALSSPRWEGIPADAMSSCRSGLINGGASAMPCRRLSSAGVPSPAAASADRARYFRMAPSSSAQSPDRRRRSGDLRSAAPSPKSGGGRFSIKKRAASARSRTEQVTTEEPSGNGKTSACPPLELATDSGSARATTRSTPRILESIKLNVDKYGRRALNGANLAAPWRKPTWQQAAVELHYSSTM